MPDENKTTEQRFPPNDYTSIKPRAQDIPSGDKKKDEIKPVARGKTKKKTFGERIAENFLATDREEIKEHLLFDWLIPGIKNAVEDIIHMLLYGEATDPRIRRKRGESRVERVPYNSIYDGKRRRDDEYIPRKRNRSPELIFDTRQDAEEVLSTLFEYVDDYGVATMKDLYSLADMPTDHTMYKWGWYDLREATVVKVREGFLLKMPKAEPIER